MRSILEISSFQLINKLSLQLESLFEHIIIKRNTILCSNLLDKGGNPVVRIDYKKPCKGLMMKVNNDSIEIKSIVNSTSEKGFASKVIELIITTLPTNFKILIDQDVSNGFWDNLIQKYPNVTFEKK
jgi:hypothetical protein